MNPKILAGLEKTLVGLLAASFFVPLALAGWLRWSHNVAPGTAWLRNATLNGMQIPPEQVAFSRAGVLSAKYQAATAKNYDTNFPGREFMIRCLEEIDLRVFHASAVDVLVGPHLSLIAPAYTYEYCLKRPAKDELLPIVQDLRRLQDACAASGAAFAVVITPNKASVYPESIPASWRRLYRPGPRYYDQLLQLMQEKGVHCVDGHRIAADLKSTAAVPLFPLGGVHWGDELALATVNGLLECLAGQGLPVGPIRNVKTEVSDGPQGQDADLAEMLNTLRPLRYPVATVTVQPEAVRNDHPPRMVLVGGSFVWKLMSMLGASQQFSGIDLFFYYTRAKYTQTGGKLRVVASPTAPTDFKSEVYGANAVVVEVNEQTIHSLQYLTTFLHDALAAVPAPTPTP